MTRDPPSSLTYEPDLLLTSTGAGANSATIRRPQPLVQFRCLDAAHAAYWRYLPQNTRLVRLRTVSAVHDALQAHYCVHARSNNDDLTAHPPHSLREHDRYHHRVLRFLHLRDGRGTRVPNLLLPEADPDHHDLAIARNLLPGLYRPPHRFGPVRPFRRSHRPQGDARHRTPHHGFVNRAHRSASHAMPPSACSRRRCSRCAASVKVSDWGVNGAEPCCSQPRTRPAHKLAWYGSFPQYGAPLGFICSNGVFLDHCAPGLRGNPRLGLAHSFSRERRPGAGRTLRSAAARRDSGFQHAMERGEQVRVPLVAVLSRASARARVAGPSGPSRLSSCSIS